MRMRMREKDDDDLKRVMQQHADVDFVVVTCRRRSWRVMLLVEVVRL